MYIFVIHTDKQQEESIFARIAKKYSKKIIGYKLIKTYPGSKPLNYFEPFTTGELSNHSEYWKPIYETDLVLKTHDGVNIFDATTTLYVVTTDSLNKYICAAGNAKDLAKNTVIFSTIEAADKFIKMNTKCFSLQDLEDIHHIYSGMSLCRSTSRNWRHIKDTVINHLFNMKFKK